MCFPPSLQGMILKRSLECEYSCSLIIFCIRMLQKHTNQTKGEWKMESTRKRYRLKQEAKDAYKAAGLFLLMLISMGLFTTWLEF